MEKEFLDILYQQKSEIDEKVKALTDALSRDNTYCASCETMGSDSIRAKLSIYLESKDEINKLITNYLELHAPAQKK